MAELTQTAIEVLKKRYFIKEETEWGHLTSRVAKHFGKGAKEQSSFKRVMDDLNFLPNSPALMNAGTTINAYSACYVLPVEDSIESIYKFYSDAAIISKSGGGVGANYSSIRPANDTVNSTGGVASGPLSFMAVQDVSTDIIKQGGRRRGANMGILMCDHKDIWEFVGAKDTEGELSNFNLSVGITDDFMDGVLEDEEWNSVKLWNELVQRAWSSAEPGVLFMDTIERGNTVKHLGTLEATNPCLSGSTRILTSRGYHSIKSLVGQQCVVWNGERFSSVTPYSTGINKLMTVHLSDGTSLEVTPYHTFVLKGDQRVEAKELKEGDKLEKFRMPVLEYGEPMGIDPYSQGFYSGDGSTGHRASHVYFTKFQCMDRLKGTFSLGNLTRKSWRHGEMLDKGYVPINASKEDRIDWLAGLLDSDGHTQLNPNSFQLVISAVDKEFLLDTKVMLSTLGVSAKVVLMKEEGVKSLPDGKGGTKEYLCQESFRLLINAFDTALLIALGLECERLEFPRCEPNRDARRFVTVIDWEYLEDVEETYCLTEPFNNTLTAEGVVIGNCGEQPLLPYESCTLGSINLSNMVDYCSDWLGDGSNQEVYLVHWSKLKETVHTAVLFLNRILDKSEMPIPECQVAMERTRKIGLGIMGLHDMLIQLGLPYDSEEARSISGEVMKFISEEADKFSTELGFGTDGSDGEGVYKGFDEVALVDGSPLRRNACLTTIAPTGSLSMLSNCSSGCEPYYSPVTYKTVLDGTTFPMPNKWVQDYIDNTVGVTTIDEALAHTELFKGANDIHWSDHVKMQGELQKYVDSSISKTINMPNEATVEDVKGAYELAYKLGCKGITVYRNNSRQSQVLSSTTAGGAGEDETSYKKSGDAVEPLQSSGDTTKVLGWPPELYKLDLPDTATAKRYRVSVDGQKVYIIVTEDDGEPMEIFVKFAYESDPVWNVLCRQLSLSLRYGVPLRDIVKQLDKAVVGVGDMSAKLSRVLKKYLKSTEEALSIEIKDDISCLKDFSVEVTGYHICPECQAKLIAQGGCFSCPECHWEKCS